MRSFVCLLLCVALCWCFVSCSSEPEEIELTRDNISEYLSVELVFGEIDVQESLSAFREKYYLTCMATISVKPKGDYTFTNAKAVCALNEGGKWTPIKVSGGKLTIAGTLYNWTGSIQLDKEGYGETTVALFCYSNTYEKMHPSSVSWECFGIGASGTVTEN